MNAQTSKEGATPDAPRDAARRRSTGSRSSVEVVQVNREDGRRTELRSVQYNGNLPASRISAYGADGQGDTAQRCYAFTFDLCGHAQGEQIRSGICWEYAPLHGRRPGD